MNGSTNAIQMELGIMDLKVDKVTENSTKATIEPTVVLSDRDFEILEFILEMKFASLEEIYEKFFKSIGVGGKEAGFHYAKKRLPQIEQAGFLKSTKNFSEGRRLYYAVQKTLSILQRAMPEKTLSRPSGNIDGRTVVHDYLLLKLRLEMEGRGLVSAWQSDRNLKVQTGILSQLGGSYAPDAIYTTSSGEKIALELEIAIKGKARYQDKINKYVGWIREHRNDRTAFKSVHYVMMNINGKKHIDHFTGMYGDYFKVEMAAQYLPVGLGLR